MLMQEERELVVEYGKKMSAARLSTGTSGNISIYNAEKGLSVCTAIQICRLFQCDRNTSADKSMEHKH